MFSTQASYIAILYVFKSQFVFISRVQRSGGWRNVWGEMDIEMVMVVVVGLHSCFILLLQFLVYSLMAVGTSELLKCSVTHCFKLLFSCYHKLVTDLIQTLCDIKLSVSVKEERIKFGGEEDPHDGDFL